MATSATLTEASILEQVIACNEANPSPETVRYLLNFTFNRRATRKIRQLLTKNNRGTITAAERIALDKYLRVGQFLDLLHAKARLSLPAPGDAS